MNPRPRIKLTTAVRMGEGKEGGAVTVCEDDDDGAVFLGRWHDNEVHSQSNFQDEDREKNGEENVVCSISSGFFAFCSFVVSSGVLVASWRLFWLALFSSRLMLFLFFLVAPFLISENADTLSF